MKRNEHERMVEEGRKWKELQGDMIQLIREQLKDELQKMKNELFGYRENHFLYQQPMAINHQLQPVYAS